MCDEVNAEYIKKVRNKYHMTQKAFAKVLGIGEASLARYEKGQKPTKAMANLIRAADTPEFMADCLDRDGEQIPQAQREDAESVIYAMLTFDEDGEVIDMTDIYMITLDQEILNEKVSLVLADAFRALDKAKVQNNEERMVFLQDIIRELALLKPTITYEENANKVRQAELRGRVDSFQKLVDNCTVRAA